MERREQYDPEDIEALLMERPFEELLPEERAFVLRHLKDAGEYEAMRATLNALRNLHGNDEPIVADLTVRENVMAAFREQKRPQFGIWLNSIGALFIPGERRGFWGPSMRLASLAAVVGIGIWGLYRSGAGVENAGIVQLHEVEKQEGPQATPESTTEEKNKSQVTSSLADPAAALHDQQAEADIVAETTADANGAAKDIGAEDLSFADGASYQQAADEVIPAEAEEPIALFDAVSLDSTVGERATPTKAVTSDAAVTREENLAEVATVAKEKETVATGNRRERKKDQEFRGIAETTSSQPLDAKLLTLQNAAW